MVWGWVSDRIGPLATLQYLITIFALVILTYPAVSQLNEVCFAVCTFAVFFIEGANFVLYVPLTVQMFGAANSASNYGLLFSTYSIIVVLNLTIISKTDMPFTMGATIMGFMTLLGALNLCLLKSHLQYDRRVQEGNMYASTSSMII